MKKSNNKPEQENQKQWQEDILKAWIDKEKKDDKDTIKIITLLCKQERRQAIEEFIGEVEKTYNPDDDFDRDSVYLMDDIRSIAEKLKNRG